MRSLRSASIGSISAWLPSRRSTLHHTGGAVITRDGHVRSDSAIGAKGRYFADGSIFIDVPSAASGKAAMDKGLRHPVLLDDARTARIEGEVLCAREAQQQQSAKNERKRGRRTGPGSAGGKKKAAHRVTITHMTRRRKGYPDRCSEAAPAGALPSVSPRRAAAFASHHEGHR